MIPSPGMATYTDKLFKLRNGRWEDILSDEVNRDVASRFAGRSVACVDRTVSKQGSVNRGISAPFPLPEPFSGVLGACSPCPCRLKLGPSGPLTVRTSSGPSCRDCGCLSTWLPPADKRACRGDLCSCHLLFLRPPPPAVCFQMIIAKSGCSYCTGQRGRWELGGPRTPGMLGGGIMCPMPAL